MILFFPVQSARRWLAWCENNANRSIVCVLTSLLTVSDRVLMRWVGILGLANKKTVAVEAGEGLSVVLATTKTKKANKPSSLVHRSHLKKDFRKMAKTVVNQV
jgi:accessory gene regulator protein AgrB